MEGSLEPSTRYPWLDVTTKAIFSAQVFAPFFGILAARKSSVRKCRCSPGTRQVDPLDSTQESVFQMFLSCSASFYRTIHTPLENAK